MNHQLPTFPLTLLHPLLSLGLSTLQQLCIWDERVTILCQPSPPDAASAMPVLFDPIDAWKAYCDFHAVNRSTPTL